MSADPDGGGDPRGDGPGVGPASVPIHQGPDAVTCHQDLVRLLNLQFAQADASLRELQARADKAGGARLPRATCADMLAGRRFPKKAVMVAFLRACRVPGDQLPAWERAWDRLRVTRLPVHAESERPDETPGAPGEEEPAPISARPPTRAWGRRRAVLSAVSAVLGVAALAGVVVAQRMASPRAASGGSAAADPGHILSDDGRAFGPGGSSWFTVTVDPANAGVRLVRRMDAGVAMQYAVITVNGRPAAIWRPLPGDATYKWRDQVVTIPRALTEGRRTLAIGNTFMSSSLGFNEFRYVVEQHVGGSWAVADTLDVGLRHTASEAAHGYRIIGQGWADNQTFAYPPREEDWRVE
ncbi:hypothetical protein [Nonomuraea zeae]|uniref:Uncharacterized protein n=1 Tax=Nonomuraea zeae TaxID=1642303 RepID=A0A5S4G1M7_9ACTN|nr:hypothetical protein [Nonomuraea zeae]TMR26742.1 hypothetical protein ETD85_41430 [Nonomuraea zeae]